MKRNLNHCCTSECNHALQAFGAAQLVDRAHRKSVADESSQSSTVRGKGVGSGEMRRGSALC